MKKIVMIVALLALLAIPMFVVGAQAEVCLEGGGWSDHQAPPPRSVDDATKYCYKGGTEILFSDTALSFKTVENHETEYIVEGMEHALSHWSYFIPEVDPCDETHRVAQDPTYSDWSDWEWDGNRELFFRTRIKTTVVLAIGSDNRAVCDEGVIEKEEEETRGPEGRITLRQNCDGWGLMQEGQLIDSGTWDLPFELEVATSRFVDYRIFEEEKCLKVKGDPTLRIGGRCTEDGDSQEIGYVFSDGDFDGAKLRITRQDGVVVLEGAGEGSDFFPARAADYSWQIIWFNGQTREVKDSGEFTVLKCDLPEDPTPTPPPGDDPPDEHPPTGGEIDAGLAVVTALSGLALTGIGGSILYMKRRASR